MGQIDSMILVMDLIMIYYKDELFDNVNFFIIEFKIYYSPKMLGGSLIWQGICFNKESKVPKCYLK